MDNRIERKISRQELGCEFLPIAVTAPNLCRQTGLYHNQFPKPSFNVPFNAVIFHSLDGILRVKNLYKHRFDLSIATAYSYLRNLEAPSTSTKFYADFFRGVFVELP
jgi:hypothetical protein